MAQGGQHERLFNDGNRAGRRRVSPVTVRHEGAYPFGRSAHERLPAQYEGRIYARLQFGAVTNAGPTPQNDWVGNNLQASADGIQVFDPSKGSFTSYYLRGDGVSWRTAGSTTVLTSSALLKPDTFFLVKRSNPNPANLVLRPY